MDHLGTLLRRTVQALPQCQEWKESLALALWDQAVGEGLAQKTKPLRLFRSTLIINVPSKAWKKELQQLRTEIITKLNENAGFRLIEDVEFRVDLNFPILCLSSSQEDSQLVSQTLDFPTDSIADQALRRSLIAAASSYINRHR